MSAPTLKIDWCTHAAAKYAVENWHYSRRMPASKNLRVGVWEAGRFVGAVVFASGNNCHIGDAYGLTALQACELVRVALTSHATPYQAAGWIYVGRSTEVRGFELNGRSLHRRRFEGDNYGRARDVLPAGARAVKREKKHKYLLPLDPAMRAQIAPLAKPYPKRASSQGAGNGSPVSTPGREGGAKPTPALQAHKGGA